MGPGRPSLDCRGASRRYQRQQLALVTRILFYSHNLQQYEKTASAVLPFALLCRCPRAEKDASAWSRDKLKSLLVGLKFDGEEGKASIETHWVEAYVVCGSLLYFRRV